jgi:hypothetical protein
MPQWSGLNNKSRRATSDHRLMKGNQGDFVKEVCSWCGKEISELKEIEIDFLKQKRKVKTCSDECETKLKEYYNYAESHIKYFAVGILLPIIIGILIAVIYRTNIVAMASIQKKEFSLEGLLEYL